MTSRGNYVSADILNKIALKSVASTYLNVVRVPLRILRKDAAATVTEVLSISSMVLLLNG